MLYFGVKGTSRSCAYATLIAPRNVESFTRLCRVREPKALPRSYANVPGPLVRADKGQSCTARLVDIPIIGETRRAEAANRNILEIAGADELLDLGIRWRRGAVRSEEHTSELQSLMRISYAVFCLKKKKSQHKDSTSTHMPT